MPRQGRTLAWLLALCACALLYAPSVYDLARTIWTSDEQAHGPIVFVLALWLFYRRWPEVRSVSADGSVPLRVLAWLILLSSLGIYVVGRSLGILMLEVGSVLFVIASLVLLIGGPKALRVVWFPVFFLFFLVPLPGPIVDTLTMPMKIAVSTVVEYILGGLGYPIGRSGVVLQIGSYQLLVADACAGLHTLFTLEAIGLLYLNLVQRASVARNLIVALLGFPISFIANVTRVIVLVLITYYLGDEAGQGFLHGFAGMLLFIIAVTLIVMADTLVQTLIRLRTGAHVA